MKIMVGVPTGEYGRRAEFYDYYNSLERPIGTVCMFSHGQSPAQGRNSIIAKALELECTHIFFLDDDMVFKPDVLTRLLKHADKDVVTGLYLMRNYPHFPVVMDEGPYEDGKCKFVFLTDQQGLIPIVNCGFGFVLIKTEVFKKLERPWVTLGEIIKDEWCDDVAFFNKVKRAGFEMYCDLGIWAGHSLNVSLWPMLSPDGKWQTSYHTATGDIVQFAQPNLDPSLPEKVTA